MSSRPASADLPVFKTALSTCCELPAEMSVKLTMSGHEAAFLLATSYQLLAIASIAAITAGTTTATAATTTAASTATATIAATTAATTTTARVEFNKSLGPAPGLSGKSRALLRCIG